MARSTAAAPGRLPRRERKVYPEVALDDVPIFFVMAGLSLNLRVIDWQSPFIWAFSSSLLAVAILGNEVYAALIIVIALTTLLSPLWLKAFYRRFPALPVIVFPVNVQGNEARQEIVALAPPKCLHASIID